MCRPSASLPQESVLIVSACNNLLWPCLEGQIELQTPLYICIEKGSVKSKHRGPLKLTSKTAEATGYSEPTVRTIVAEKSEISEAACTSPPKRY